MYVRVMIQFTFLYDEKLISSSKTFLSHDKNQSGAWHAEAVDRAVTRKLEKIKTLQGFKKFSGWRSRRNLQWVMQGMSCKRSIEANL